MRTRKIAILLLLALAGALAWGCASRSSPPGASPPAARPARPWRIAYYQGGDYIDYAANLRALAGALAELGWIQAIEIPAFEDPEDAASIWQVLSERAAGPYLEFAGDAFWSAGWDDALRSTVREAALARLAAGEVDLAIAMGTWAGQDLANDRHDTPTMVLTSSDPIEAGILDSADDSGHDHVLVEVDPERYRRQIRLFHDVVGFQRLGVVHEDSPDGRVYANVADLEQVAEERGFSIVPCHAEDRGPEKVRLEGLQRCYRELAPRIDALWIATHTGEQPKYMPGILAPMVEHRVPTWAQIGPMAVRRGALISIQPTHFEAAGRWYAETMGQILNGAQPRSLNQVLEMPGQIVVNLETARRIGFEVPKGVLAIADQTYQTIEGED